VNLSGCGRLSWTSGEMLTYLEWYHDMLRSWGFSQHQTTGSRRARSHALALAPTIARMKRLDALLGATNRG
jgi:hypothetical protein